MTATYTITTFFSVALLSLICGKAISLVLNRNARKRLPYPPGPKPKFLIGNALDFPQNEAGQLFMEWGKKANSDILHISALGNHAIVINSRIIAEELLEKRAKLYSDRPWIPAVKLIGWDYNLAMFSYGDAWRHHRKVCQQNFNRVAAQRYHPIQTQRVHHFVRAILNEPEKIFDHNKMLSVSITLLMMYGYEPTTLDDPVVHAAEEAIFLGAPLLSSSRLINIIPILRHIPSWVPGAKTQRTIERVHRMSEEVKRVPIGHSEMEMREGRARSSLVTDFLEKKATEGVAEGESEIINNVAWTVYAGKSLIWLQLSISAADTTIAATGAFLHAMVMHPDIQRKAQAEIGRVIGSDRLPVFDDRKSLPYIEAIYREVMRWRPPLCIGVPHALTEDDMYEGYFIPKDPDAFKPERFFDAEGRLNDDDDARVLAYGFGLRICAGKHVASATMWLTIASFIACFDIQPAKDEAENEIEIDEGYDDFFTISQKKPFKCSITPRTASIRKLIEATDR